MTTKSEKDDSQMTFALATHWLMTKLRDERSRMIAAGDGWTRPGIADAVRKKYEGTEEWLQMQAAIASRSIKDRMVRILQQLSRADMPAGTRANAAEWEGIQRALPGLELRDSYVIDHDGSEQATELMTGDEARQALRILDMRIADDTVSRNRLQSAIQQIPEWIGERTLLEAVTLSATVPAP